jgi:hypothetical protein
MIESRSPASHDHPCSVFFCTTTSSMVGWHAVSCQTSNSTPTPGKPSELAELAKMATATAATVLSMKLHSQEGAARAVCGGDKRSSSSSSPSPSPPPSLPSSFTSSSLSPEAPTARSSQFLLCLSSSRCGLSAPGRPCSFYTYPWGHAAPTCQTAVILVLLTPHQQAGVRARQNGNHCQRGHA